MNEFRMKHVCRNLLLVLGFAFVASTHAADPKEIFTSQVYPLLRQTCMGCHASRQKPYFVSNDLQVAYDEAKPRLDASDVEQSILWIRSQNEHCGLPAKCGQMRPELLAALREWATVETVPSEENHVRYWSDSRTFSLASLGAVGTENPTEFLVSGPGGERLRVSGQLTRLSVDSLALKDIKIYATGSDAREPVLIEGFFLHAEDSAGKKIPVVQNFRSIKGALVSMSLQNDGELVPAALRSYAMLPHADAEDHVEIKAGFVFLKETSSFSSSDWPTLNKGDDQVAQFQGGGSFACASYLNGSMKCWGANSKGQLGRAPRSDDTRLLPYLGENLSFGASEKVRKFQLNGEAQSACTLSDTGSLYCWGWGFPGLLGESRESSPAPRKIPLPSTIKVADFSLGPRNVCVLSDDRKVYCWGANAFGVAAANDQNLAEKNIIGDVEAELQTLAPINLGSNFDAKAVSVGNQFVCASSMAGQVKCWGYNRWGQLGVGDGLARGKASSAMGDALPAVNLGSGAKVKSLALGSAHVCAALENGSVQCWGDNRASELTACAQDSCKILGDAPGESLASVTFPEDFGVATSLSASDHLTCALSERHKLACFGSSKSAVTAMPGSAPSVFTLPDSLVANQVQVSSTPLSTLVCAMNLNANTALCGGNNAEGAFGIGEAPSLPLSGTSQAAMLVP